MIEPTHSDLHVYVQLSGFHTEGKGWGLASEPCHASEVAPVQRCSHIVNFNSEPCHASEVAPVQRCSHIVNFTVSLVMHLKSRLRKQVPLKLRLRSNAIVTDIFDFSNSSSGRFDNTDGLVAFTSKYILSQTFKWKTGPP